MQNGPGITRPVTQDSNGRFERRACKFSDEKFQQFHRAARHIAPVHKAAQATHDQRQRMAAVDESHIYVSLWNHNQTVSYYRPKERLKCLTAYSSVHTQGLFERFCTIVGRMAKKLLGLTFDQPPVVQLAGQGMCVLQDKRDSGLGTCSQSLGCRAFCSSALTAWMHRTVLLVWPELPQLVEHFCHSPTHQLTQRHTKWFSFNNGQFNV